MTPEPELHELAVRLGTLSQRSARQVLAVLAQVDDGLVELSAVPELVAVLTELGRVQAGALTTSELAVDLGLGSRLMFRAPELPDRTQAVRRAAETILNENPDEYAVRLERLARSEVSRAGQDAREEVIQKSELVEGWTRGLDSTSCQLCRWWWRGGRVWPKSHRMPRHTGCTCVQVPVLRSRVRGVSRSAYEASKKRWAATATEQVATDLKS